MHKPPMQISATGTIHATKIFKIVGVQLIPGGANAELIVQNGAGVEFIHVKAVQNETEWVAFCEDPLELTGMIIQTLTSGAQVHIYLSDDC